VKTAKTTMVKMVVQTVHEDVEEVATTRLLLDVLLVVVVVAEAGNTWRSDGELVGQFISSCRLAGRRVARSSPTQHTRAHPPHVKKERKWKNEINVRRRRRRRPKKEKKKPPRNEIFLFFFYLLFLTQVEKPPQKIVQGFYGKG
jgi:hypothetical protein